MKRIDLFLSLAGIAIVLLAVLSLLRVGSAEPETEPTASAPMPSTGPDVVILAVPEIPVTPTPEPDKPAYDPAVPLSEDLQYILWAACEEHNVDPAIALGLIEINIPGADGNGAKDLEI